MYIFTASEQASMESGLETIDPEGYEDEDATNPGRSNAQVRDDAWARLQGPGLLARLTYDDADLIRRAVRQHAQSAEATHVEVERARDIAALLDQELHGAGSRAEATS